MTTDERLTAQQAESIRTELAELEGPRRTEVVAAIKKAREYGDLSDQSLPTDEGRGLDG